MQLNTLFGYAMIITKSKDEEELKENLKMIIENIHNEKYLKSLKNILSERFPNLLEDINIE